MGCKGERTRCPLAVGTSPWQQIQLGRELRVERKRSLARCNVSGDKVGRIVPVVGPEVGNNALG